MPSSCAAKPVIYLYPEEKTDVSVTLNWEKKLLRSIPEYDNGWSVTARPSGLLTDSQPNKDPLIYPYLFWEDVIRYPKPASGFVVRRADLNEFFSQKLTFLGLNPKEIADFKAYWIPSMQDALYYRISFLGNSTMDKAAPITILPRPDSIQRVFMDFEALAVPVQIPEQHLLPFVRSGFTAIEWGGKMQD